ncbi:hypothetical protein [Nocardioides dilutus]
MTWRSLLGTVVAVAVAATPALAGMTNAPASASAPERAVKNETTISIRVNDRRVEAGETTKVRGNLNIKKSDDEPGRLVTLEAKTADDAAFTAIGTATAGPRGGLKLQVAPAVTTRYRWYYPGDADTRASRSGVARIVVGPGQGDGTPERIKTTLSIRATDRPVDHDGDSLVRGKLLARGVEIPHRQILLLARTAGNPFAPVATARTDRDGVVRFPVSPTVKTAYRLKFQGTRLLRPARSGVVRIGVRPEISASASPSPINPGESSTVSGLVTYEGAPYVGATVDLLARHPGRHGRFSVVATGTTDPLGAVSFVQSPLRTTVYRLLVRHSEGTPPRAVSDNVRVVVRTATSLSIRGRTTPEGYAVSGVLRGGGGPIAGRIVSLELLGEDGLTWTAIDSARTKKRGKVKFLEPISEGASYRLSFAGGHRLAPSVSGVVVN